MSRNRLLMIIVLAGLVMLGAIVATHAWAGVVVKADKAEIAGDKAVVKAERQDLVVDMRIAKSEEAALKEELRLAIQKGDTARAQEIQEKLKSTYKVHVAEMKENKKELLDAKKELRLDKKELKQDIKAARRRGPFAPKPKP
jgi:hypothetical protein